MAATEIQFIKMPILLEEEEDDDEMSKELSDKMLMLSMKSWLNLNEPLEESNALSLDREARTTLPKIEAFIQSLEAYAKVTKSNRFRKSKLKGEGQIAKCLERLFQERIGLGMHVVNRLLELLRLEKLDFNKETDSTPLKRRGSISEFEPSFQKIIARFARILEARGIKHDLQVSPEARASLLEEERKAAAPSADISETISVQVFPLEETEPEEKEIENAAEFLHRIVSKNNLTLEFRNVPTKDPESYEHYYACDFDQFTVTAKGATRLSAKNNSAVKMMKLIMREQQRRNSISLEKFALLSDNEFETAIRILCLTENYVLRLRKVCEMHTAHLPKFITLGDKPVYTVRCEALGYKAIGTHKRLYIAKKIAAKKLLLQMPNEGDNRRKHDIHPNVIKRKDNKMKFSTTFRESTLN